MKKLGVRNADGLTIGYLHVMNQMYYPYTLEGMPVGNGFFSRQQAEAFLVEADEAVDEGFLHQIESAVRQTPDCLP